MTHPNAAAMLKRAHTLIIGTKKGAWVLGSEDRKDWEISKPLFFGQEVYHLVADPREPKSLIAATATGHMGPTVFYSNDGGVNWKESSKPPAFPEMTEEEAAMSDLKHIITRSVGFEREVQADVLTVNVSPGDAFLLCSDGLCNYIDLDEFTQLARQHYYADLPQVCMDIALERGGEDNITVIVIGASNGPDRRRAPRPQRKTIADTLPPLEG